MSLSRCGGTVVYSRRFDSGGMFNAEEGVERFTQNGKLRFRAFVSGSFGGGRQCFRDTLEEAKAELERMREEEFG